MEQKNKTLILATVQTLEAMPTPVKHTSIMGTVQITGAMPTLVIQMILVTLAVAHLTIVCASN
ncbi:hypothetical protein B6A10_16125 [Flavobacterium sp. L1I52]|uniref:Uncharacterized protein n=1 Tax=Flavobacterium pokkalii TaxID=1940408 RepID=A0ABR7UVI9_9FLAO|nr:hypothetical protein [Flavobacterium pokkalii]